jgi:hypothetical protein
MRLKDVKKMIKDNLIKKIKIETLKSETNKKKDSL